MSKDSKTFAFDFDGVVAQYDGFRGEDHVGEPVQDVIKAIRELSGRGHTIIFYSTRGSNQMKEYCKDHDIPVDYFNRNPNIETGNPGKPVASVYVDDRAVTYNGQSHKELVGQLEDFTTYWEE